jgi:nitronate monooxygenase
MKHLRTVIQGGMGIYVSSPFLAKATAMAGALGTVSGAGFERILVHILQLGDPGEHYRRALAHFPDQNMVKRILAEYFIKGGKPADKKFKRVPMFSMKPRRDLIELTVVASFCAVWLSKEGHSNPISINYLEKVQIPHMFHLTGAMLAGVDVVTMGAGIPRFIPEVLRALSTNETATYKIAVEKIGGGYTNVPISFNPWELFGPGFPKDLPRPDFLPIVSSNPLAEVMVKKTNPGDVSGLVFEREVAGGHNAPPRGKMTLDELGQPIYGPRDKVDFDEVRELGVPFWIGGGLSSPEGLREAQALGAVGTQNGSIFALSNDSGMNEHYRATVRRRGYNKAVRIIQNPIASPTDFPFQVADVDDTLSNPDVYNARVRECERSALQAPYELPNGRFGFKCASEPVEDYRRKGGKIENTVGRVCLCDGLFATVGLGNPGQAAIVTMGSDISFLPFLMKDENDSYTAADAINWLLSKK